MPSEAIAKIIFFIRFTSYNSDRSAGCNPPHFDAKAGEVHRLSVNLFSVIHYSFCRSAWRAAAASYIKAAVTP
jgi:hypothetical protein